MSQSQIKEIWLRDAQLFIKTQKYGGLTVSVEDFTSNKILIMDSIKYESQSSLIDRLNAIKDLNSDSINLSLIGNAVINLHGVDYDRFNSTIEVHKGKIRSIYFKAKRVNSLTMDNDLTVPATKKLNNDLLTELDLIIQKFIERIIKNYQVIEISNLSGSVQFWKDFLTDTQKQLKLKQFTPIQQVRNILSSCTDIEDTIIDQAAFNLKVVLENEGEFYKEVVKLANNWNNKKITNSNLAGSFRRLVSQWIDKTIKSDPTYKSTGFDSWIINNRGVFNRVVLNLFDRYNEKNNSIFE